MFIVVGLSLCLLAGLFVVWPLLRGSRRGSRTEQTQQSVEYDAEIRAIYKARLGEVSAEVADEQLRDELKTELGAVLLTEQGLPSSGQAERHVNPRWLLALALAVPVLSVVVYFQVSDPRLQELRGAEAVLRVSADDTAELESWRLRLSERVADEPEDNMSWYLLGHAYLKLGRFADAAEAFATTNKLAGEDLNVLLYWLQARYLNNRGVLDDVSRGLADRLLAEHPNFPVVLEMLALDAFRRGAYPESIKFLNQAMSSTSDETQQAVFANAIEQVRANIDSPAPGVSVDVSAGSKVPDTATIFVIARPVGGGMPYAVVRKPAVAVPFTARLDDLASMSETRLLSSAEEFEVLVRLSLAGTAMAQPGDWEWRSAPLRLGEEELPNLAARLSPP